MHGGGTTRSERNGTGRRSGMEAGNVDDMNLMHLRAVRWGSSMGDDTGAGGGRGGMGTATPIDGLSGPALGF